MDRSLSVLLVTEASSAGVGRHLLDLADGLARSGQRGEVAYSPIRSEAAFLERLESLDVRATRIPMRRMPHPQDWAARGALKQLLASRGPFDVLHLHSTKAGLLGRTLGRATGSAAVLYTPHCLYTMNPDLGALGRRMIGGMERWLAPRTDALVAVSPDEEQHAREQGLRPKTLCTIPNGVGPIELEPDARGALGLPPGAPVLGFIGRLSSQKNPIQLLEVFAQLRRDLPQLQLAVAGTGPMQNEARDHARQLGLGQDVHWLGHQSPARLLAAIDVLCMPSRYEGMPYVLLETGASGVPVVVTPVGGSRLCVENEVNGTITDDFTTASIAAAAKRWLDDEAARDRVRAGVPAFLDKFGLDPMVQSTLELYRRLAAGKHPEPAVAS